MNPSTSRFQSCHRNSGFTLIELLVVIAIIAILAGLSFAGIDAAMKAARRAQAGAMINQLRIAMTSYNTEYGIWPVVGTPTGNFVVNNPATWEQMCIMLNGNRKPSDTVLVPNPDVPNARGITFMEFSKKDLKNPNGVGYFNYVVDPTRIAATPATYYYRMILDADYNNVIELDPVATTDNGVLSAPISGSINAGVAIYSIGGGIATKKTKPITTW